MTDEGAEKIASAIRYLADAIHPGRATAHDAQNGVVGSVTEAMMGQTAALTAIANELAEVASAVNTSAEATEKVAEATNGLLYGLKFGKQEGTSVAEAIENAGQKIGDAVDGLTTKLDEFDELK